jgi:hypothetical protein
MTVCELTGSLPAATQPSMNAGVPKVQQGGTRFGRRAARVAGVGVLVGMIALVGGCVNVAAPDKPIVIELNINIRQEVIYRLDAEAAKTIEENKDIF